MKKPAKEILQQYHVDYKPDTAFASHARLLQSQWREKMQFPKNDQPRANYGNFIETTRAKSEGLNFLTGNIKKLVPEKIAEIRANGGLIGEPRIWNNMLSSQPLCFNLFGEMYYDLDLATTFFKTLFPNKVSEVTKVDFEYSSRRGEPDNSAFDVYVEYLNGTKKCFFGIEVKYQENLREESKAKALNNFQKHQKDYIALTKKSGFFKENVIDQLNKPPYAQIWRDHLLAENMSEEGLQGDFIFLYPFKNEQCKKAVENYQKFLISNDESVTKFHPRDLDVFIQTLHKIKNAEWTKNLLERYVIAE